MEMTFTEVLQTAGTMIREKLEEEINLYGEFNDQFISLPDPNDAHKWYYIVLNLTEEEFQGGYYMGVINNVDSNPYEMHEEIIDKIKGFKPECWNPAWKVT